MIFLPLIVRNSAIITGVPLLTSMVSYLAKFYRKNATNVSEMFILCVYVVALLALPHLGTYINCIV